MGQRKERGKGRKEKKNVIYRVAVEMTKRIKHLSHKHGDLSLDPQWPCKNLRHTTVISAPWRWTGGFQEFGNQPA